MQDAIVAVGGETMGEFNQTVSLKTAEFLVLGEDEWKDLPQMYFERAGATACFLP